MQLRAPKDIIIVILIQTLAGWHLGRIADRRSIIETNIQQPDLKAVVTDELNQLVSLRRDGLLVEKHEQPVEPLGGVAVRLRPEGEENDFFLGRGAAGARVTVGFLRIAGWSVAVDVDFGGLVVMRGFFDRGC